MRRFVIGLIAATIAGFLVLGGIAGSYLGEHLNGKEDWNRWKAERIAKGDRFDWQALAPPPVPDEDNFAMAPIVAGGIRGKDLDPRFKALDLPRHEEAGGDWRSGRREDLSAYAKALGSEDLLGALNQHAEALRELDKASLRPRSRLPIDYAEYETIGLLGFRGAGRVLKVRAIAHLSRGEADTALADVMTLLRIANHLRSEPCLLASLLRTSMLGMAMQVIWEGLAEHRWNDRQLALLQQELRRVDLLSSARLAGEGERMMPIDGFTKTAEGTPLPRGLQSQTSRKEPLRLGRLGKGWWYRNLIEIDQYYASSLLDLLDPKAHRIHPDRWVSAEAWIHKRKYRKDLTLALIALPALGGQVVRISRVQSGMDQAIVVCGLERFRRVRGAYPASLAELVPEFMDRTIGDLADGASLRYRRSGESFLLYSVGWNMRDDGGQLAWNQEAKPALDLEKGDWVWASQVRKEVQAR